MNLIILGAPGSGKGTQARFIINKYGITHISTGDMLRAAIKSPDYLGNEVKEIINHGNLVPDELVITLVKERIMQDDCKNGFLLDGFPRNIKQALSMKEVGINIDYVLNLMLPDTLIFDRLFGRRIHASSGRIYHVLFNPPKQDGKDDITSEPLIIRNDDQEETIRNRLIEYHQQTAPVINYYLKEAKLGNTRYFIIDGSNKISDISARIACILG